MTILAVQETSKLGGAVTWNVASADGDAILNNGNIILLFSNADAEATRTVTIAAEGSAEGVAVTDVAVTVAISGVSVVGPFPVRYFNDESGRVSFTYDDESDLSIAVLEVG